MENYRSETINNIAKALSSFQSKVGSIKKNKEVEVIKKTGGKYIFFYADQGAIFDGIKELLGEFGLSYSQIIQENGSKLITILMHESGEWIQSEIALMMHGDIKSYGGDITYKRRYALSAILGLATENDDDGSQAPDQIVQGKDIVQDKEPQKEKDKKFELLPNTKAWDRAILSYKEHGNLDLIKQHANISEENEKLLIQACESDDPY